MSERESVFEDRALQAQFDLAKELREEGHSIGTRIAAQRMLASSIGIMRDMDRMNALLRRETKKADNE